MLKTSIHIWLGLVCMSAMRAMLRSERSDSCISFIGVWQSETGESGSGRTALSHVQILHGRFLCMRTRRAVVQYAKAVGELAAGGIQAAGVGADCSGMVTDCSAW